MIPRIKRVIDIDDKELQQLQTRVHLLESLYAAIKDEKPVDDILVRLDAYGIPLVFKKLKLA